MPIAFDRSICCDLNEIIFREWLITNGQGGYAAGTVPGVLTRMQHGLLVAPAGDAAIPHVLLAKIDEEIFFDQRTYELGTNEYRDGTLNPAGFVHLETFHLEEGFPVFTYHLGGIDGIALEKRIWMPQGQNTTYIQYRLLRRSDPASHGTNKQSFGRYTGYSEAAQRTLSLKLLPFSTYRPIHTIQRGNNDWHFSVQVHSNVARSSFQTEDAPVESEPLSLPNGVTGCTIRAYDGATPYSIFVVGHPESETTFIPTGVWYWNFLRRHEQAAGRPAIDDLYLPGVIRSRLWAAEDATLTIIVTTEELSTLNFSMNQLQHSYKRSVEGQRALLQAQRYFGEGGDTFRSLRTLPIPIAADSVLTGEEYLRFLVQAADRFLIHRTEQPGEAPNSIFFRSSEKAVTILSSYFDTSENIRDALIALPGLALVPGRYDEAYRMLRSIARYFRQGLLPDHIPAFGQKTEEGDYGNVDNSLWFFYALDHYLRVTRDFELLDELYAKLVDCIDWYIRGTWHGIRMDAYDGLLQAHAAGRALTWMNAKVSGVAVTPRSGKPVEVNALWFHALSLMHEWSQRRLALDSSTHSPSYYFELARHCQESFQQRFWNADVGTLYDVVDGATGDDAALRPNQLFALSLRYPVLAHQERQRIFTAVTQHLLTPYGLRSLAPEDEAYSGHVAARQEEQQRTLHQGSAWPWLMGAYIDALLQLSATSPTGVQQKGSKQGQAAWWLQGIRALEPFSKLFREDLLAMVAGAYDGDAPQSATYHVASVMSVAELLRAYNLLTEFVNNEAIPTKTRLAVTPHL